MADDNQAASGGVKAQLGCGTLILIAIIVAVFSGRGDIDELRDDLSALRDQVTRLEAKIDTLGTKLGAERTP
jgi:hypothetical protein